MLCSKHSKNAAFLFSGDIAARAVGFLITIYLARVLGKADFGAMNIGLTLLTYALLFGNCGLNLYGTREVAASDKSDDPLVTRLLITRLGLSFIIFLIVFIAIPYAGFPEGLTSLLRLYLLYMFPAAVWLDWFYQGRQQMGTLMIGRLFGMIAYLLMVLLLVHSSEDLINTAVAYVIGGSVNALIFLIAFYKLGYRFKKPEEGLQSTAMLRSSFVMGIATLASQLVLQFPVLYLGWTATLDDVGLFSAAFKLLVMLLIFDRVFYTLFYPAVSKQAANNPDRLPETLDRLLRIAAVFAICAGFTAIVLAEPLIGLVFGETYVQAVPLFQFLTGYFVLTMLNSVIGYTLMALKQEKRFTRAFLIALVAFFLMMLFWPNQLDAWAVAGMLTIYQGIAMLLMAFDLSKHYPLPWWRGIMMPIFTLLVALTIYSYVDGVPGWLLLPFMLPLLMLSGGIEKSDVDYLKRILR